MRIVGLRAVPLSAAPGDPPLEWVGGRIETWDAALVEITTADGVTGVGEAAQGIMAAAALPGLVAALRPYAEGLEFGHPREVGDALRDRTAFWARGGIAAGAVAAVEVAAFDAMGKALGVPAYELLGGLRRDRVEVYASGGLGVDEDQVVAWARAMEADGFGTVKFRAMTGPDRTIGLVDKVLAALRPETRFVLDAVQGCAGRPWPHQDVLRVGRHLERYGPRWYEEPCRAEDVAGYTSVRSALDVPVSGVESYSTRQEFERLVEADGADVLQPDVGMVGGPVEFQRIARLAREAGLACVPHIWSSGVNLMASLHAVFATEGVELAELCTLPNPLREALCVEPPRRDGSFLLPPSGPGLGVALTPEIEQKFPFRPGGGHVIR
ncbi:mandelate racemase/muconate lactonizing enzyme family protein [Actinomadura rupiterrae]|uniref:mandelate racemase/muconate lactonizing enzyme family protein n=1 Tax=Actinomadura rupiterrae TaxID=559627 RepID=UPI0020A34E1C|nr:mandelate racemase/muconate lactonizing enzyme family protein [Actinomadura rupiterrae]MCP2339104.1 L-alanine-DL-glutamate epimerase-like enolase superfamily enzyme [Actinomadura rupiterrae]